MSPFSELQLPTTLSHDTWSSFVGQVESLLDAHQNRLNAHIRRKNQPIDAVSHSPLSSIPFGWWRIDGYAPFPACLFPGVTNGILFEPNTSDSRNGALACVEELILFCLAMPGSQATVIVIDCWKLGATFAKVANADRSARVNVITDSTTARETLRKQVADYRDTVARGSTPSKELTILILVDFPNGLDAQACEDLALIVNNANESDCIVFAVSADQARDISDTKKVNSLRTLIDFYFVASERAGGAVVESGDNVLSSSAWEIGKAEKLSQLLPLEVEISSVEFFHDVDGEANHKYLSIIRDRTFEDEEPEQLSSHLYGVSVQVGSRNNGTAHKWTFGNEADVYAAIVGGQSGKGKSTLLDTFIARSLVKYDSDQLRYFIFDCSGTSFRAFDESTSVQYIVRSSSVDQCAEAAKHLETELDRREQLFRAARCADIAEYVTQTRSPLHRLICIVDEFHILYTGKQKYVDYFDTLLIQRIARVGRKLGVHLIASTQTLGDGVRRSYLDNIPLRIALGMTEEQSQSFLSFGNRGASNLRRGRAIYNATNGSKDGNREFDIDLISPVEMTAMIANANIRNATRASFDCLRL